MELQALTPMLRTWDLPATRAFYTGVLGFTCDSQSPTWASLKRNRVALMITTPNNHEGDRAPAFTGSLYFRTDQVDANRYLNARSVKMPLPASYPCRTSGYH